MKRSWGRVLFVAALSMTASSTHGQETAELREVEAFASIGTVTERSVALFDEMAKVLTHPRCLNCHPVDDRPRQDQLAAHQPPVVRGENGFGVPGMRCATCHGTENVSYVAGSGSIPGHEPWHLAPRSMGWIGLSNGEICEQIKDPERNGGKTLAELHRHNAEDGLVGWGWNPGEGREPAPGSQDLFGRLTKAWIDSGAHCPG